MIYEEIYIVLLRTPSF